MEDLAEKISELLSDPEIMSKLKNFTSASESSKQNKNPEKEEQEENNEFDFDFPSDIVSTIMKLAPILSSMQKEDKHTKFLKALKPLISEKRQEKLLVEELRNKDKHRRRREAKGSQHQTIPLAVNE